YRGAERTHHPSRPPAGADGHPLRRRADPAGAGAVPLAGVPCPGRRHGRPGRSDRPPAIALRTRPAGLREHGVGCAARRHRVGARVPVGRRPERCPTGAARPPGPAPLHRRGTEWQRRAGVGGVRPLVARRGRPRCAPPTILRVGKPLPDRPGREGHAELRHAAVALPGRARRGCPLGPRRAGRPAVAPPPSGGRVSSRRESISRRWPALLVLLVVVVAAGFVDHSFGRPKATVRATAGAMPVAPPAGALSSTWYCAGGTAASGGGADMGVAVVNDGN